jgi:hypothetical protein
MQREWFTLDTYVQEELKHLVLILFCEARP